MTLERRLQKILAELELPFRPIPCQWCEEMIEEKQDCQAVMTFGMLARLHKACLFRAISGPGPQGDDPTLTKRQAAAALLMRHLH